jgi:dipeptidyl-peptidase-4
MLADNNKYIANLKQLDKNPIEFFNINTETGVDMDGYMILPSGFDESRTYPVIFYVYGEPAGQTARDRWGGTRTLWHMMLAQQGYIVVTMDNRGSPSPKGRDWRKALYRNIGVINVEDQAMGAKELLKLDYVDQERVAVWGWSGGGSMTLNLLFHYPEIYQTGMSIAPVGNQLLYDNIYQERYMGVPWETKEDYIKGSPVTYASKLEGNLLLIHGTGDDNVHYQNSEVVINELIKHNKQFDMFSYPNRTHAIKEGENTSRHLYSLLTRYLKEHVEPGGKASTELKTE